MDPAEFKSKTREIFYYVFHDDDRIETDGSQNETDAVKIAEQLRRLGDHYEESVIQPLMKQLQKAAEEQVPLTPVFSNTVESLWNTWVAKTPELASEKYLLKATMQVVSYIQKNCPNIRRHAENAAVEFVGNRLASWILEQGGWEQVSSL